MSTDTPERDSAQATDKSKYLAAFHERIKAERVKPENADDVTLQLVEPQLKGVT
jgi:hypothetical protein